jgi:hypothetical protein
MTARSKRGKLPNIAVRSMNAESIRDGKEVDDLKGRWTKRRQTTPIMCMTVGDGREKPQGVGGSHMNTVVVVTEVEVCESS